MKKTLLALASALILSAAAGPVASAGPAERAKKIAQALRTKRISKVSLEKATLDELVRFLRTATGFNFHVRREVIAKANVDLETVSFTFELEDVTVAGLLELALPPHGLSAVVRDTVVHVTTKADAEGPPVARLYPISHLTWKLTDFIAPSLDLHPSNYTPPDTETEVVREGGLDAAQIVELVKEIVPRDWAQEGWAMTPMANFLLVRAPASVQTEVALALARVGTFQ